MKMKRAVACLLALLICFILPFSVSASESGVYYNCKCYNGEMKIALTFDDGPHPRKTPQILNILEKYGIKSTFFLIGQNIKYYPDAARMIIDRGHEIGNHTFTHPHNLNQSSESEILDEMNKCEEAIKGLLGYKPTVFRPPEGVVEGGICKIAKSCGYNVILWSIDTRDWAGVPAEKIVSDLTKSISPGDIILMHDYTGKKSHTAEALELMIPELLKMGYSFVTVSELINK